MAPPVAVVLMNMGGPASMDAVEPFLFNLFRDRDLIPLPLGFLWQRLFAKMIARFRARKVRDYYEKIGGRSPISDITRAQADKLQARLNLQAPDRFSCHVAMRYSPPFTDEVVREIGNLGAQTLVALSLYPHYTTATTGSSLWELRKQLAGKPPAAGAIELIEIEAWPDDPLYLDALAKQVQAGLALFPDRSTVEILFSAHGLPESFVRKGDPYVDHLHKTIHGVMARVHHPVAPLLTYQSRVGPVKWLEPSTDATLRKLAAEGRKDVLVVPISFVSDHVETLYEIDILFGEEARALGLNFHRAPSLNTEPAFIEALAQLVERALAARKA